MSEIIYSNKKLKHTDWQIIYSSCVAVRSLLKLEQKENQ